MRLDIFHHVHNDAHMNEDQNLKKALADINNAFVKALTEPARLEILRLLTEFGPMDVKSMAGQMPQDRSVISRHLSMMEKAGILKANKEGRHVIYEVDGQGFESVSRWVAVNFFNFMHAYLCTYR